MGGFEISVTIFGGLGLFLFGMKIMSESLQMAAGDRLKAILWKVTNNRILGVVTGFFITSVVQSSSATTVMLVSFVSAGLLTLTQSIGIIFGANIGTTVTGWLVAILGFKIKIATFALPAIGIGFFLRFLANQKLKQYGEIFLGFGILFLGLDIMSGAVQDLRNSQQVMHFMAQYSADTILSALLVVGIGGIITMLVQSSSATMAMTMTLAVNGLIDFPTACALILGENIGTTITANIAAIGASTDARRAALAHLIFNVTGVIWVLLLFHNVFVPLVDYVIPGDPSSPVMASRSIVIADHMAAFHTVFNVTNALLFLPFARYLANLATFLIPTGKEDADEFHLKYISTVLVSTPAININQARLEMRRMSAIVNDMFDRTMDVFHAPSEKLGNEVEEILKLENTVDRLEKEISDYLVTISQHNISQDQSQEISSMLHMVNELERIGDQSESILKLIRRKYDQKIQFTNHAIKGIDEISGKVRESLELINSSISVKSTDIIPEARVIEDRIDELRKELRKGHVTRLNMRQCDVDSGLLFIDMLSKFEKIGDHAFNVAESISGIRIF